MTAIVNPSGRLIHYSRKNKKAKVLLDHIWFANGVALPHEEDFVLVCDTHSSKISKVWLKGSKAGESEMFVDRLPGSPDNLTFDTAGIWIPLATAGDVDNPMAQQLLAPYSTFRKFLARLCHLILMPFEFIHSIYPNQLTNFINRVFYSMDMIKFIVPPRRSVIRLDWKGNIVESLHGSDNTAGSVTHALKLHGHLYLGSVTSNYIARVKV